MLDLLRLLLDLRVINMLMFRTPLPASVLGKYLDSLDRGGLVYCLTVGERKHTSTNYTTTLHLVVDGDDGPNKTEIILKGDGTWTMETNITVGDRD